MLKTDSRQIYDEIMSLPEVYRTPVFLYYIQELSTSEIADVLGINAGAVRTKLSRARERLQKRFRRGEKHEFGGTDSRCKSAFYKPYRG
jgi:RNA polymerase sigma-70 factor, ECF subfamily